MSPTDILMALEEAFEGPNWADRIRELCTADCEFVDVGPGEITDVEGFIGTERNMMTAWSNVSTEQVALVGDEHHAMIELRYRATHDGPLRWHGHDFEASGREWQMRFVRCISVKDGKITSIRDYFNDVSFMRQLGILIHVAESAPLIV